jgi:hypothetical protein
MSKDWIQTRSGKKFFPLKPMLEDIVLSDIAHALSNICRYTGHVSRFYSVGEHSVRVSRRVLALTNDPELSLWGLMHDASEAYLADIARPVKHQTEMTGYRVAEHRLQQVICQRFGLPLEEPKVIHQADVELLSTEAHELMQPLHPEWASTVGGEGMPKPLPIGRGDFMGWAPEVARARFNARYDQLRSVMMEKQEFARSFMLRELGQLS